MRFPVRMSFLPAPASAILGCKPPSWSVLISPRGPGPKLPAPENFGGGSPSPPQGVQPDNDPNPALPPLPEGPYVPRQDSQPMSVAGGGNFAALALTAAPGGPAD